MLDQYPPRVTRFSWWYTLRLGAATFLGPVLPTAKPRNLCARSWEATLCMRKGWLSIRVGMPALGFKWWSCGFTCETCWPSVRKQVLIVSNKLFYSSIISFCDSLIFVTHTMCGCRRVLRWGWANPFGPWHLAPIWCGPNGINRHSIFHPVSNFGLVPGCRPSRISLACDCTSPYCITQDVRHIAQGSV